MRASSVVSDVLLLLLVLILAAKCTGDCDSAKGPVQCLGKIYKQTVKDFNEGYDQ